MKEGDRVHSDDVVGVVLKIEIVKNSGHNNPEQIYIQWLVPKSISI